MIIPPITIKCRKGTDQPAVILISIGIEDLERISWHQSSSLFHEYGHALHSVYQRTSIKCSVDQGDQLI